MSPIIENYEVGGERRKSNVLRTSDLLKLNLSSITCVSFLSDGKRLLSGNAKGFINCWDVSNLGVSYELLATVRISELGIISLACKTD